MTSRNAKTEVNGADELQNKVTQDLFFYYSNSQCLKNRQAIEENNIET